MDEREIMSKTARQVWMSVLARATRDDLEALITRAGGMPGYTVLKPAETGTVMVEARAGGTGRRFNLGEATLSRCVVQLADGTVGFAYALGTDRAKAALSAVIDAMLQQGADPVLTEGVAALRQRQDDARTLALRKAAATKVDFFTMVRGHD